MERPRRERPFFAPYICSTLTKRQLVVSYSDDDVYLFDVYSDPIEETPSPSIVSLTNKPKAESTSQVSATTTTSRSKRTLSSTTEGEVEKEARETRKKSVSPSAMAAVANDRAVVPYASVSAEEPDTSSPIPASEAIETDLGFGVGSSDSADATPGPPTRLPFPSAAEAEPTPETGAEEEQDMVIGTTGPSTEWIGGPVEAEETEDETEAVAMTEEDDTEESEGLDEEEVDDEDEMGEEELSDDEVHFGRGLLRRRGAKPPEQGVPIVHPVRNFHGHINSQTSARPTPFF